MVPPSAFLIALMSSSGIRTTSKRRRVPMGSFRLVLRRAVQLLPHQQLDRRARVRKRLARMQRAVYTQARGVRRGGQWREALEPLPDALERAKASRCCGRSERARSPGCDPLARGVRGGPRRRALRAGDVEQHVSDIDRADPVDHAVVRLGGERPAPAVEALEQGHLPQRPAALQALGEELRRPFGTAPARRRAPAARRGRCGASGRSRDRLPTRAS